MKRIFLFVLLLCMFMAVVSTADASVITEANNRVNELIVLVTSIGALIAAVYAVRNTYKNRDSIKQQVDKITDTSELRDVTKSLIAKAAEKPTELYNTLLVKPTIDLDTYPNESKNAIVSEALKEKHPTLLNKLGLDNPVSIANFVTGVYKGSKPLIKLIKGK